MTADKNLKRLVRERMRETGETYIQARKRMLALKTVEVKVRAVDEVTGVPSDGDGE